MSTTKKTYTAPELNSHSIVDTTLGRIASGTESGVPPLKP